MELFYFPILLAAIIGAVKLGRGYALALLVALMVLYPEFIRVKFFVVQFSVARLFALFIILYFAGRTAKLNTNYIDKAIVLVWIIPVLASLLLGSSTDHVIFIVGRVLDTILMYYAARYCIRDERDIRNFVFGLGLMSISIALLAVVETVSKYSIYEAARYASQWAFSVRAYEDRLGFARAYGSTLNPIYLGLSMYLVFSLILVFSSYLKKRSRIIFLTAAGLSVMTSMSSGPLITMMMFLGLCITINNGRGLKRLAALVVIVCILAEIFSNRHFYSLIDYFTFNSQTAWYRSRLIEVAIERYEEYLAFGVSSQVPNHWGAEIDGRPFVDLVNQYLIVALRGGIVALVAYLVLHYGIISRSIVKSTLAESGQMRSIFLKISFAMLALNFGGLTVGFFNPVENLIYISLGIYREFIFSNVAESEHKVVGKLA